MTSATAPYTGTVKSLHDKYGFIICQEVYEMYGRDTFINRALTGEITYGMLNVGQTVTFDVSENPRGEPVAVNINGNKPAKGWMLQKGAIERAKGLPKGAGTAVMGVTTSHHFPPDEGKGWGDEQWMDDRPDFIPPDAKQVTLQGELGWFVSQRSCDVFERGMKAAKAMAGESDGAGPQGVKRSMGYANNAGEGDWYGQGGNPAKQARYENPGLVNGEFIYNGFVKQLADPVSGYGYISDGTLAQYYQGKEAFFHLGRGERPQADTLKAAS
jgi:cold shock CspA family protein